MSALSKKTGSSHSFSFRSVSFRPRRVLIQALVFLLAVQPAVPPAMSSAAKAATDGRLPGDSATRRHRAGAGSDLSLPAVPVMAVPAADNFGIVLTPLSTAFNSHIGIEHHQPTRKVVGSANQPSGQPYNFELIEADGAHRSFSNLSGLPGEFKLATARDDGQGVSLGGFRPGELFTGTGAAGVIARLAPDGAAVQNPWVTLPGETGPVRGGLYVDRTGVFAGDLIAVTASGGVWRITAAGAATRVASLGARLEGVTTVPNDVDKYGPWAGKILAGAKDLGLVYAIDAQGNALSYQLGINPAEIKLVPPHENFYGVDAGARRLVGAPAAAFTGLIGEVLVAQESPGVLSRVHWNGTEFEVSQLALATQWKQITFSPAGVAEIAAVPQIYDRIAVVRHAPALDSGRIEGALWQLLGEPVTLDGYDTITSDLLLPGTPTVTTSGGQTTFGGVIDGTGSTLPAGYAVTLTGNASLRYLVRRTDPIQLDPVAAPPAPAGTRDVTLSQAGQSVGDFATLRHLTLSGKAGQVAVPPGTYGRFTASGQTALVLGVAGSTTPAVYNLEELALSGGSELRLAGPVTLTVKNNVTLTGATLGAADNPRLMLLKVAAGAVSISGTGVLYGVLRLPQGTLTIEGNGRLRGTVSCDRLLITGNGVLQVTETDLPPPPINRPPTVQAGPDLTITLPVNTIGLNGAVSDDGLPAGSTLSVAWTKVSGPGPVTFANAGSPVTTATFTDPGTYVLRLTAADTLLVSSDEVTVTVIPRNRPPTVDAGPDQTIELPAAASLRGVVTDDALPSGSTVTATWSKVGGPGAVTFADPHAAVTTASFSVAGAYTLRLSATDTEFTVSDDVVITVNPANQAPVVNAGANQTVTLGANLLQNPSNEAPLASGQIPGWTQVIGNAWAQAPAGFPASLSGSTYFYAGETAVAELRQDVDVSAFAAGIAAGTQAFEFKGYFRSRAEAPADTGHLILEYRDAANAGVLATVDSGPLTSTVNWSLFSNTRLAPAGTTWVRVRLISTRNTGATNDAYFDALSLRAVATAAVKLNGTASDDGLPTGSTLATTWGKVSGPGTVTFANPNVTVTSASFDTAGTYVLKLTASDGALTSSSNLTVTVNAANQAPVANAGAAQTLSLPAAASLNGTATDDGLPAGGTLVVSWSQVSGPGTVTFSNASAAATTASFSQAGTYVLRLLADDSDQISSSEVTITVNPENHAPTVDAGPDQTITLPAAASLNGTVTDDGLPAGSAVSVTWSKVSGPGTVTFADPNRAFTTASFSQAGVYVLRLTATDSLLTASDDMTITVSQENHAPNVNAGPNQRINLPNSASLNGAVTDDGLPAGSTLSVAWSKTSGPGAVTFGQPSATATSASFSAAGTYVLRLTASDSQQSSFDELIVLVNPPNQAPVVDAGPDQTITFPAPAILNAMVTDDGQPTGSTLSLTWSKVSGPGAVTFSTPHSASAVASFAAPGTYTLQLAASDSLLTTSRTLSVTVNPPNQPPVVDAGPDQTITVVSTASLRGTVSDDGFPTGGTLTMAWSKVSGPGTVTFGNPQAAATSASFSATGVYTLRLTASDSQLSSSDDLIVTVGTCPAPSGLVAWWPGEGNFNDFVGANHGTPSGGTTFLSGNVGQGFSLNGVDGAITVPDAPALTPANITLEAWIKFDSLDSVTSDAGLQYLAFKRGSGAFEAYSLFKLRRDGADRIHFLIGSDATLNQRLAAISTTTIVAGQFYHVVGTYDGINARIYINGVMETTQPVNYAIGYAAAKPLVFGSSGEAFNGRFKGVLDELKLYNRALTAAEVQSDYAGRCQAGGNHPPAVNAGADQIITLPATATINGSVSDDGLPAGSTLAINWSQGSGPGTVTFSSQTTANTVASFSQAGTYVLRLSASDTQYNSYDDITITVNPDVCQFAASDLAAWWTADGSYTDVIGGNNGTPVGGTTFVAGKAGQAFGLNGTNAAVSIPDAAVLKPANISLEAWVKFDALDSPTAQDTGLQYIVFKRGNGPFEAYSLFKLRRDGVDRFYFTIGSDPTINLRTSVVSTSTISAGQFYHLVGTYDGSSLRLYLNGHLEATQPAGYPIGYQTGKPLLIGSSGESFESRLVGVVDEVKLYPRPLTEAEVLLFDNSWNRSVCASAYNHPPVVNAGADQTITMPTNAVTLSGTVTDDGLPAGSTLSLVWSQVSGPALASFSNPNLASPTVSFSVAGTYVLRLSASDSQLTASDDVVITVNPGTVNQAPIVNAGPDQTITLPATVTLAGTAADDGLPTGSTLSVAWSKVSGPGTVTFTNPNAAATTASFSAAGTYVLRLTASDTALTSSDDEVITVNPAIVNQPPTVNTGANQSTTIGANLLSNPGNEAALVNGQIPGWTQVSGAWTQATAGANGFPASVTGSTYFYPGNSAAAELRQDVDVSAWATSIANGTQQFEFKAYYRTKDETPSDTGQVIIEYRDATNTQVLATLTSSSLTSTNDWKLYSETRPAPAGTGWIRIRLLSTRQSGTSNDAYFDALSLRALALGGVKLGGVVSDDGLPAGSTVSATWSKVSGPGTVTFANPNVAATTASFSAAGTYVLRLTASDTALTSSSDLTLTISPANQAPEVNAGADQTLALPQTASMSGTATDDGLPVGSPLSLRWSQVSGPGTVTFANASAANTTASFSTDGVYVLRLSADDGDQYTRDDVVIVVNPENHAPVVKAGPDRTITLPNDTVSLGGTVTDDGLPVGGTLTVQWSQVSGPGTVSFSAATSASTSARFSAAGYYVLRLTASDTEQEAVSELRVTVTPANRAPVVNAGADRTITLPTNSVSLSGTVSDDGLPTGSTLQVSWTQVSGPSQAQFGTPSAATTTVSFNNVAGTYVLRLQASDGALIGSDDVVVTVVAPNQAPRVDAGPDQTIFLPNAAQLTGSVSDDGLPAGGTLTRSWSKVSGPGTVTFSNPNEAITSASFSAAGVYTLRLTANDSQLTSSDDVVVTVNASPGPPPIVAITSPADGAEITTRTDVTGTVGFSTLAGTWRLEYSLNSADGVGTQSWVQFASGSSAVSNAFLGKFDPTLLLNGVYAIRLTAIDASGQAVATSLTVLVTGNQKVGHFTLSFNDLAVPLPGLPLQVLRTYDSRDKRVGDFGVGWRLSVSNVRVEKTAVLGQNWEETSTGGNFPTYSLQPTKPKKVMITFPDGKVYKFQAVSNPQTQQLVPIQSGTVSFVQMPGTTGTAGATLEAVSNNAFQVDGAVPGVINLIDTQTIDVYNPTRFRLRTAEGYTYVVSQGLGLESVTDLNGNTLTVNVSGYIHSAGQSVAFVRDALGRITSITDPAGHALTYSYDVNGDLVSFTDQESNTTTFTYDANHNLKTIKDPRNIQPLRNDYDADGRLISTTDAFNQSLGYLHDLDNRRETITDRLGRTTIHEYDANGNVTKTTDAKLGVTLYSYDSRDNLLSTTNALGKTTSYTYDASDNKLTETDPLNHTTTYTYNSRRQVLTLTDARSGVTTNTYDANGNLISTQDAAGKVTTFAYDAFSGQRVRMTDALGGVTSYAYDRNGYLSQETDALGNVTRLVNDAQGNVLSRSLTRTRADGTSETLTTSYEYDRQNRLTKTTATDGSFTRTVYNSIGQVAESYDQLNRKTSYDYDAMGRVVKTTYPDTTFESATYDAEGRRLTSTDRANHITSYEYDELGRVVKTTYADTSFTTMVYDAIGRVTSVKDARGNETKSEYDDANRRTKVTDARLKATTFAYDANGNQQALTDANNHTTAYEYDALNRRTKTIYHDGTFSLTGYDDLGRTVSKTDQADKTTQYEYDRVGRLVKVTGALGQVTRYSYDEVGNQLTQTDANNHTTSYGYDALGRRVKRRLPGGQVEGYTYNLTGTVASRTDFNGKTTNYTYDALNRLLTKTPDASLGQLVTSFTYTALGQRLTMVDASGTTTYTYDNRNRLTSMATPQGALSYSYDAASNLQAVRSSNANGVTAGYTYDVLNWLAIVKDNNLAAGANTTTYSYDDVGNLAGYLYPNGVQSTYTYNSLNRLTNLTVGKTATLASFAYVLGNVGNRLSVTEQSGRKVDYTYDALYRLTEEKISLDPNLSGNGVIGYSYDPVGNRQSRTSAVTAIPSATSTYDANDRLITDGYDANGNTTGSNGNTYQYDFENRLVKINAGTPQQVSYIYDGDGNRVAKTVGGVTTKYLVDTNNPTGYAQVVEELVSGSVQRVYTYGLMRISQRQLIAGNWTASFYGYDGHGSVRLLTNADGAVTNTYTYDAFGNLINRAGSTPNDFLYTGEQLDTNLGLYHLRARYFNADTGRFFTQDSYEGHQFEPRTLHKYLYANANPANLKDPSGQFSFSEAVATFNYYTNLVVLTVSQYATAIKIGAGILSVLNIALFLGSEEYRTNLVATAGPSAAAELLAADVSTMISVTKSVIRVGAAAGAAATALSPSGIARSFQGSERYPGVDRFRDIIIKKGTKIYAGEPGISGFFTTERTIERVGGDATKLFERMQVAPYKGTYRSSVAVFEVLEDTPAAFGIVRANPQYGQGGFPQIFIQDWQQKTRQIGSTPLTNYIPPGGE